MSAARAALALALLGATAPLQCPARRPTELRHEEGPEEALWLLAERFGAEGAQESRTRTLRFLIERYPTSRYAERARLALEATNDGGS